MAIVTRRVHNFKLTGCHDSGRCCLTCRTTASLNPPALQPQPRRATLIGSDIHAMGLVFGHNQTPFA